MIRFTCLACQAVSEAPESAAGKMTRCPDCGASIRIPLPPTTLHVSPEDEPKLVPIPPPLPPAESILDTPFSKLTPRGVFKIWWFCAQIILIAGVLFFLAYLAWAMWIMQQSDLRNFKP